MNGTQPLHYDLLSEDQNEGKINFIQSTKEWPLAWWGHAINRINEKKKKAGDLHVYYQKNVHKMDSARKQKVAISRTENSY